MTPAMFGALILLAATVGTPSAPSATPAATPRASATAKVSIRIVSGVRFGPDQLSGAAGADRRKAQLAEADGLVRPAELLEFQ